MKKNSTCMLRLNNTTSCRLFVKITFYTQMYICLCAHLSTTETCHINFTTKEYQPEGHINLPRIRDTSRSLNRVTRPEKGLSCTSDKTSLTIDIRKTVVKVKTTCEPEPFSVSPSPCPFQILPIPGSMTHKLSVERFLRRFFTHRSV